MSLGTNLPSYVPLAWGKSNMRRLLILTVLAAMAALSGMVGLALPAQAQESSAGLTVVAIDRQSISSNPANVHLAQSFLNLLFHLRERETFTFVFIDDFDTTYGPVTTGAEEFIDVITQVEEMIAADPPFQPIDMTSLLAQMNNYLQGLSAPTESEIIILTGGQASTDVKAVSDRIGPTIDLFTQSGWEIISITAPGTDPGLKSVLDEISMETGGESFDLSVPEGYETIADRILRRDGSGSIANLGRSIIDDDSVFDVPVDIAPGTSELNMVFFRELPVTVFRLTNPDGFESSAGDRTSSTITEFHHVVIWELVDPVPGRWNLEVRGAQGHFSANAHYTNRYGIEFQSSGAAPLGQPINIVAMVTDNGQRAPVDAMLTASITDPSGTSILHDLNDEGRDGDAAASDGFFSATIPPVNTEGTYGVELQMAWPDIAYTITTLSSFEAQSFPIVSVTPEAPDILEPGARTKIATLFVNIEGQPYSVPTDALSASIAVDQGDMGAVEVVPQQIITEGKAFAFDVFYTPAAEVLATVVIQLDIEYAGRQFSVLTDQVILSSVQPTPTPAPIATATPPEPTPVTAPPPPRTQPRKGAQVSMIAVGAILGVIGVAIIALAAYWLAKPKPFGYIYSDEDELVVDFAQIPRTLSSVLTRRNIVLGDEVDVAGLSGIAFVFQRGGRLSMIPTTVSPTTVRVSNQPVTDSNPVFDNTWIGAAGRLYIFTHQPKNLDE
jgi:hypothetical protein